jgi:electron transfer flavoprotein alpha/beta subunit
MKAKRKPLKKIDIKDLNIELNDNFKMMSFDTQPEKEAGLILDNVDTLIDKISSELKTI